MKFTLVTALLLAGLINLVPAENELEMRLDCGLDEETLALISEINAQIQGAINQIDDLANGVAELTDPASQAFFQAELNQLKQLFRVLLSPKLLNFIGDSAEAVELREVFSTALQNAAIGGAGVVQVLTNTGLAQYDLSRNFDSTFTPEEIAQAIVDLASTLGQSLIYVGSSVTSSLLSNQYVNAIVATSTCPQAQAAAPIFISQVYTIRASLIGLVLEFINDDLTRDELTAQTNTLLGVLVEIQGIFTSSISTCP